MSFELPGNSQAWSVVLGPVALASLASLLSLLGAVLRWREDPGPLILLAPLAVATPLLAAHDEKAGYLVMGLLVQPLGLWAWSPVVSSAVFGSFPGTGPPRWAIVATALPVIWVASCTYEHAGWVNGRIALLESLPVPQGTEVVEKDIARWHLWEGTDNILYRVPMPIEEAEREVYRRFQEEGWVRLRHGGDFSFFLRDGECVHVHMQIWLWSPEWSSSENTHLRMWPLEPDEC